MNDSPKEPNHRFIKKQHDKVKFNRKLKEIKIKYINNYKRSHCCVLCGESSPCCLEFHHLHRKHKLFTISSAIYNIKIDMRTLKAEIHKCVILCSNHHKKLHSNEINVQLLPDILDE